MIKTILHISNRPYAYTAGGTEVFLRNLINSSKAEFKHVILGEELLRQVAQDTDIEFKLFKCRHGEVNRSTDRIKQLLLFPYTICFSFYYIFRNYNLFKNADVVSLSTGSRNSIVNFSPILHLLFPRKRQVYIHHGMMLDAKIYHTFPFKNILTYFWNKLEMIYICNSQREVWVNYGLNSGEMIYNAIEYKPLMLLPQETKTNSEYIKFLFVGRFSYQKGIDTMLKAFSQVNLTKTTKKIELQLLGSGEDEEIIKKLIKELNLESKIKIIFLGYKPPERFYKQADVCVFLSRSEGFGYTPIEAFNYGVPTITSNILPFLEIKNFLKTEDKNKLIAKVNDVESSVNAIEEFLIRIDYYTSKEYKVMLNQTVRDNFDVKQQANKYINFYNK